jgi:hypothetical protein
MVRNSKEVNRPPEPGEPWPFKRAAIVSVVLLFLLALVSGSMILMLQAGILALVAWVLREEWRKPHGS